MVYITKITMGLILLSKYSYPWIKKNKNTDSVKNQGAN